MTSYVCDIETNGLLPDLTKVHCLVIRDRKTGELVASCTDDDPTRPSIEHGLQLVSAAEATYWHNGIRFDIPAIQKVYPNWTFSGRVFDTLVLARSRFAHQKELDFALLRRGRLPKNMLGKHSLEAWGYRLGFHKGDFKGPWDTWSLVMQEYCELDTLVTLRLVEQIAKAGIGTDQIETEMEVAQYLYKQEQNGFPFDENKAQKLYAHLAAKREEMAVKLRELFGSWQVSTGEFIPKRDDKKRGYVKGVPVERFKTVEFNPASRQHIANRLQTLHGWQPEKFTDGGHAIVDEDTLVGLKFPGVEWLVAYLMLDKRCGQLAEGNQAWLKHVGPDGAIHGVVDQSGCVTHRASHRYPNMGQVPSIKNASGVVPYGKECRELFTVNRGWKLVGSDMSGIELRCLGNRMAKYDGGEYIKLLLEGDIHTINQHAAGLETRDLSKRFIYAFLYGAGDRKLGSIVLPLAGEEEQKALGKKLRRKFLKNLPALSRLLESVKLQARTRGYLRLVDGRRVYVRAEHSALNTLLQGDGAVLSKRWIVEFNRNATKIFGPQGTGVDSLWAALAWVHDELEIATRVHVADDVGKTLVSSIESLTSHYKLACPLTGAYKVGLTWADVH